jgi:alpha-D-xyloside xylohydrolase
MHSVIVEALRQPPGYLPKGRHLERQYMLGDDLLVAPVFRADGDVSYYVPDGTWTHVLTGVEVTGPRWHREQHSFMSVPLLARPGSVIPVGAVEDRPDYDYADGVTLHVYQLADGASRTTRIPVADPRHEPLEFTVSRTGPVIKAAAAGGVAPGRWQVLLAGIHAVGAVAGGTATAHPHGTLVSASGSGLMITLSAG